MAELEISRNHSVTVVELGPDYYAIDGPRVGELETLSELAETIDPPKLLLSLSHTQYMSTAFLGLILKVYNQLKSRSGEMGVCTPHESTLQVFTTMHLDQLFGLFGSFDEAIDALTDETE